MHQPTKLKPPLRPSVDADGSKVVSNPINPQFESHHQKIKGPVPFPCAMRLRRSEIPPNEKSPNENPPKLASFVYNENLPKPLNQRKYAEVIKSTKICRSQVFCYYHTCCIHIYDVQWQSRFARWKNRTNGCISLTHLLLN